MSTTKTITKYIEDQMRYFEENNFSQRDILYMMSFLNVYVLSTVAVEKELREKFIDEALASMKGSYMGLVESMDSH